MTIVRDKFDFDIGYLIQSPCKTCTDRTAFPSCMGGCLTLHEIQTLLAGGISCTRDVAVLEVCAQSLEGWGRG
jgi:hypothetical protein